MKELIIDIDDLKNNLNIIKDKVGNQTQIIAVVKANGMGLDLIKYSEFLVQNGIEFLAVSNTDEAILLRQAGINAKILMLSEVYLSDDIELLINNDIILTIGSLEVKEKIDFLAKALGKKVEAHVKIDTGLSRFGFLYSLKEDISEAIKSTENLSITGMYTHFSKAIDEKWTRLQFKRFKECMKIAENENIAFHCSNTTAALKYPEMKLDYVRIGSGIQGRVLSEFKNLNLKKIGTLKTRIVAIKNIPKGYNVGYSNEFKTKKETKIAILPVGYMDGINVKNQRDSFSLKNNILAILMDVKKIFKNNLFKVKIRNNSYNVIGRLGMFHTAVDITSSEIELNDEAEIEIIPMYINSNIRREYIQSGRE